MIAIKVSGNSDYFRVAYNIFSGQTMYDTGYFLDLQHTIC